MDDALQTAGVYLMPGVLLFQHDARDPYATWVLQTLFS